MRMPISSETRAALELLKEVQTKVRQTEDLRNNRQVGADLNALISVLESPVFQSILNIQDSLRELKRQVSDLNKNGIWKQLHALFNAIKIQYPMEMTNAYIIMNESFFINRFNCILLFYRRTLTLLPRESLFSICLLRQPTVFKMDMILRATIEMHQHRSTLMCLKGFQKTLLLLLLHPSRYKQQQKKSREKIWE